MRIGINGFGRIGRLLLRSALTRGIELDVVAINVRSDAATNAHLFQFDSTYGTYQGCVQSNDDQITIDGRSIKVVSYHDPHDIPWRELGVELVIESTGAFTSAKQAAVHLRAGAERVLVTAPSEGADVTLVVGVNEHIYHPLKHQVVSAASCTTNALAPVASVLHERFGLQHGLVNTIHAYTSDQRIVDCSHKDLRRARAGAENIIPTTTGATRALGEVIPALAGRFHGVSYRVPINTVSVLDLVAELEQPAAATEINAAFAEAACGPMAGILGYTDLPLVSGDFRGDSRSSIVDGLMTAVLCKERTIHLVSWYDNEWGYASRIADLASFMSIWEREGQRSQRAQVAGHKKQPLRTIPFAPEGVLL